MLGLDNQMTVRKCYTLDKNDKNSTQCKAKISEKGKVAFQC